MHGFPMGGMSSANVMKWRNEIYKRQSFLIKKEKSEETRLRQSSIDVGSLLKNPTILERTGKGTFIPFIGSLKQFMDRMPEDVDSSRICAIIKAKLVHPMDVRQTESIYQLTPLLSYKFFKFIQDPLIIKSHLLPIERLQTPTNDIGVIRNLDVIMPIISHA